MNRCNERRDRKGASTPGQLTTTAFDRLKQTSANADQVCPRFPSGLAASGDAVIVASPTSFASVPTRRPLRDPAELLRVFDRNPRDRRQIRRQFAIVPVEAPVLTA
jgi:hypothetical protein